MRRVLVELSAAVRFNAVFAVNVHVSVGVDGDEDFSNVGVNTSLLKPAQTGNESHDSPSAP